MDPADVIRRNVQFLRAQRLETAEDRARWSQEAVATRMRLARTTYLGLEAGQRGLSVGDLLALAIAFDVSPQRLLRPPQEAGSVAVGHMATVEAEVYMEWLAGLTPLPEQDRDFFDLHERERTPIDHAVGDGRRSSPADTTRGVAAEERVVEAHRALDALLRARTTDDWNAVEHHQDMLETAIDAVAAATTGANRGSSRGSTRNSHSEEQ